MKTVAIAPFLMLCIGLSVKSVYPIPPLLKAAETKTLSATTLKTDFTLSIIWILKDTTENKKGSFTLKKPNMYRVELGDAIFVNDGKTVSRYSPGLKQLVIQDSKALGGDFQPGEWLFRYSDRFTSTNGIKENINGTACESFSLTPKEKDRFKKIDVSVSLADSMPRKIRTVDRNDNEATYMLNGIVLNSKIADKTFKFKPPKGTETIDMRE
ncbi:MAG: outer membrane lipoprotein carrier protein LolA [Fibrobacteres bacterium]|nr:outer membrane lipoprotein carrier protein LolA [Fibrobacterota bacterium]